MAQDGRGRMWGRGPTSAFGYGSGGSMCELCDARRAATILEKNGETFEVCRQCKLEHAED